MRMCGMSFHAEVVQSMLRTYVMESEDRYSHERDGNKEKLSICIGFFVKIIICLSKRSTFPTISHKQHP